MLKAITRKVFGSRNERYLKSLRPIVEAINAFEPQVKALDDDAIRGRIVELRQEVADGRTLDDILPEVFAIVREASVRSLGMRHYDVQMIGGVTLHQGKIAEMRTGEGKTLVATLPVVLNALSGKGAHLITVNDYLARRDAAWMGKLYNFLGLSVGVILHGLTDEERQVAYGADTHLRHQQRVWVRLPARQHEVLPGTARAAAAQFRHRRRSGLHPHRRSPHAADSFPATPRTPRCSTPGSTRLFPCCARTNTSPWTRKPAPSF